MTEQHINPEVLKLIAQHEKQLVEAKIEAVSELMELHRERTAKINTGVNVMNFSTVDAYLESLQGDREHLARLVV